MPGTKLYKIEYLMTVIEEDIPTLPTTAKIRIKKAIEERLMTDPITFGKPLRYSFKGHRRLRVGDYRVVYRIDNAQRIVIIVTMLISSAAANSRYSSVERGK